MRFIVIVVRDEPNGRCDECGQIYMCPECPDAEFDNDFDLEELQEQNRLDEEQDKLAREQLAREQAARPEPVIEISF